MKDKGWTDHVRLQEVGLDQGNLDRFRNWFGSTEPVQEQHYINQVFQGFHHFGTKLFSSLYTNGATPSNLYLPSFFLPDAFQKQITQKHTYLTSKHSNKAFYSFTSLFSNSSAIVTQTDRLTINKQQLSHKKKNSTNSSLI